MKAKLTLVLFFCGATILESQTVYVPGGMVGSSSTPGYVGVGTNTPAARLHVAGGNPEIRFDYDGYSHYGSLRWSGLQFGNNGVNRIVAGRNVAGGLLDFYVNNTNEGADYAQSPNGILALRLNSNGHVGVGTASPATTLDVAGSSVMGGHIEVIRASGSGHTVGLGVDGAGSDWGVALFQDGAKRLVVDQNGGVLLGASYVNGSAPANGLSVQGNVGIGTMNPTRRLQVYSNEDGDFLPFEVFGKYNGSATPSGGLGIDSAATYWGVSLFQNGNKLFTVDANGGVLIGSGYQSHDAPINGAIIQGNVGIGTSEPTHKLSVNGTIKTKEVIVETTGWADYVFADDYALKPLAEVEAHIKQHKHLPGIPSAKEAATQGVSLGEMQARLLAKIEELTLHAIAQEKKTSVRLLEQEQRIQKLEQENRQLRNRF
jgi:hypothetical protein